MLTVFFIHTIILALHLELVYVIEPKEREYVVDFADAHGANDAAGIN